MKLLGRHKKETIVHFFKIQIDAIYLFLIYVIFKNLVHLMKMFEFIIFKRLIM